MLMDDELRRKGGKMYDALYHALHRGLEKLEDDGDIESFGDQEPRIINTLVVSVARELYMKDPSPESILTAFFIAGMKEVQHENN